MGFSIKCLFVIVLVLGFYSISAEACFIHCTDTYNEFIVHDHQMQEDGKSTVTVFDKKNALSYVLHCGRDPWDTNRVEFRCVAPYEINDSYYDMWVFIDREKVGRPRVATLAFGVNKQQVASLVNVIPLLCKK